MASVALAQLSSLLQIYSTFVLLENRKDAKDKSSPNEDRDRSELMDALFAWSILPKRLAHSLLETIESWRKPQVIIITEMTQSAV